MDNTHLVVVGASLAGVNAVGAARESGYEGPITLVGAEDHLPYDRPPLSKENLGVEDPGAFWLHEREHLESDLGVSLRLGTRAVSLDVNNQLVETDAGSLPFSSLVLATGSTARPLPQASGMDGVIALRTYDDAVEIRRRMEMGSSVIVIGAGLIGSEIASAARARGLVVTIIERSGAPMSRTFGADIGREFMDMHLANGVHVISGQNITSISSHDGTVSVTLEEGRTIAAELVVVGIGSVPATGWLRGSGLALSDEGAVVCNDALQAAPHIFAAGDLAEWLNPQYGRRMRQESWTSARLQGRHAGRNAVTPGPVEPFSMVPYMWTELYGHTIKLSGTVEGSVQALRRNRSGPDGIFLYRNGDEVTGVLTIGHGRVLPRIRRMLENGTTAVHDVVRTIDQLVPTENVPA